MSTPRPLALAAMVALLALAGCSGLTPEPVAALRGRLELSVEPNPIVAIPLGGDRYELKFDIVMREAGGVGVRPIGDPAQRLGEVKRLWVRPDLRRGGVATDLMSAIETRARQLGYERLYLETGPAQPEALALYVTTGWTPVDEFPPGAFAHRDSHRFTKAL